MQPRLHIEPFNNATETKAKHYGQAIQQSHQTPALRRSHQTQKGRRPDQDAKEDRGLMPVPVRFCTVAAVCDRRRLILKQCNFELQMV
jgi:hypothetical protein